MEVSSPELDSYDIISFIEVFASSETQDTATKLSDWWTVTTTAEAPPLTPTMAAFVKQLIDGQVTPEDFLARVATSVTDERQAIPSTLGELADEVHLGITGIVNSLRSQYVAAPPRRYWAGDQYSDDGTTWHGTSDGNMFIVPALGDMWWDGENYKTIETAEAAESIWSTVLASLDRSEEGQRQEHSPEADSRSEEADTTSLQVPDGLPLTPAVPYIEENPQFGYEYNVPLEATGGVPPYTWQVVGGLPHGLRLKDNVIRGTPSPVRSKEYGRSFGLRVRDSSPHPQRIQLEHYFCVYSPVGPRPTLTHRADPDLFILWMDSRNTGDFHASASRTVLNSIDSRLAKAIQKLERAVQDDIQDWPADKPFEERRLTANVGNDVEVTLSTLTVRPGGREIHARLSVNVKVDIGLVGRRSKEAVDSAKLGTRVGALWFAPRFFVVNGAVSELAYRLLAVLVQKMGGGTALVRRTKNLARQSTYKVVASTNPDALVLKMQQTWQGARVQADD
ncbi:hypothetical protein ACFYPT_38885 [Streptomyces sp. NPDC005529]|uniref:hypothetical protein n=1 Tax=unclassified Streptomyces TaxID=2593676 RepID=UPI0033A2260C